VIRLFSYTFLLELPWLVHYRMKWADLVNYSSQITQTILFLLCIIGSAVIQFIILGSHSYFGLDNGCKDSITLFLLNMLTC